MQPTCKLIPSWTRLRRTLLVLFTLLLCLQLYALTQHHHDLSQQHDDCPACNLAADFSGGMASIPPAVVLVALAVAWWLTIQPRPLIHPARRLRVRPPAQAPPQV
jgi:hypothetical protein